MVLHTVIKIDISRFDPSVIFKTFYKDKELKQYIYKYWDGNAVDILPPCTAHCCKWVHRRRCRRCRKGIEAFSLSPHSSLWTSPGPLHILVYGISTFTKNLFWYSHLHKLCKVKLTIMVCIKHLKWVFNFFYILEMRKFTKVQFPNLVHRAISILISRKLHNRS